MVSERPRQKTISAELAGLNDDEVKASREKNGENRLSTPKQRSFMKQFFSNLGGHIRNGRNRNFGFSRNIHLNIVGIQQ